MSRIERLEAMALPALWKRYEEVTGTTSRSPNKRFLAKAIIDAEKANRAAARAGRAGVRVADATAGTDGVRRRGRFAGMTVDQLRALYEEKVGRSTDSLDAAYMRWKIRRAEQGRIPVGPVRWRKRDEPVIAVTLRFGKSELERLDQVVESAGGSRTRFLMSSIAKQLEAAGEVELARSILGEVQ